MRFIALAVSVIAPASTAYANTLADFAGTWVGGGSIAHRTGPNEKVTCRMVYTPAGADMRVSIRCSRQDGRFEASAHLKQQGTSITGTWSVSGYNADGALRGTRSGNSMNLAVSGSFAGTLALSVNGRTQSMSFTPSGGSEFTRLSANMSR